MLLVFATVTGSDCEMKNLNRQLELFRELEKNLTAIYGPTMANEDLSKVLGFSSMSAFRQALVRKTVPIAIFAIEKRKGKFALTTDVAAWLAEQREKALSKMEPDSSS